MKTLAVMALLSMSHSSFASEISVGASRVEVLYRQNSSHIGPDVVASSYLHFQISSCHKLSPTLVAQKKNPGENAYYILVKAQNPLCNGPFITRSYKLQLSSQYMGEEYIVLNPVEQTMKSK